MQQLERDETRAASEPLAQLVTPDDEVSRGCLFLFAYVLGWTTGLIVGLLVASWTGVL